MLVCLKKILAKEGDVVKVGKAIAIITTEATQVKNEEPVTTPVVAKAAPVIKNKSASIAHASTMDILM